MRHLTVFTVIAILSSASFLRAQALPGDRGGYTLTPPKTAQLKGAAFLYASVEIREDQLGGVIPAVMEQFADLMTSGQFLPSGGPVFVYQGDLADRTKPFKLQMGYPVADGTKAVGGFQVGRLEPHRSATAVFVGSTNSLGQAYAKLYTQIAAAGLTPGDERRERYLYYEDQNSKNNIMLIEIELKDQVAAP